MVLPLAAYHSMDKTHLHCNTCKLNTFYSISDQESNCLYQIPSSLNISFHICFCKPIREQVCDKRMSLKAMNLQKEREYNLYNGYSWLFGYAKEPPIMARSSNLTPLLNYVYTCWPILSLRLSLSKRLHHNRSRSTYIYRMFLFKNGCC
jgi:hypothetical protein